MISGFLFYNNHDLKLKENDNDENRYNRRYSWMLYRVCKAN
jgi:hypothetical protein